MEHYESMKYKHHPPKWKNPRKRIPGTWFPSLSQFRLNALCKFLFMFMMLSFIAINKKGEEIRQWVATSDVVLNLNTCGNSGHMELATQNELSSRNYIFHLPNWKKFLESANFLCDTSMASISLCCCCWMASLEKCFRQFSLLSSGKISVQLGVLGEVISMSQRMAFMAQQLFYRFNGIRRFFIGETTFSAFLELWRKNATHELPYQSLTIDKEWHRHSCTTFH